MSRVPYGLVVGGVTIALFGWRTEALSYKVKEEPQTLSVAQLEEFGPGENHHVVVTDFASPLGFVHTNSITRSWDQIWCPVISLDGELAGQLRQARQRDDQAEFDRLVAEAPFSVIAQFEARDLDDFKEWAEQDSFQGVVITGVFELDKDARQLLEAQYPYIDLDNCWVVDMDRNLFSADNGAAMMLFGVVMAIVGAGALGLNFYATHQASR